MALLYSTSFPGGSVVKNRPTTQKAQEAWVRSLHQEDPLEEGMATHSGILAWRIPRTEEPGELWPLGLQSWMLLKRLGTLACTWLPIEESPIGWLIKTVSSCNQHP